MFLMFESKSAFSLSSNGGHDVAIDDNEVNKNAESDSLVANSFWSEASIKFNINKLE